MLRATVLELVAIALLVTCPPAHAGCSKTIRSAYPVALRDLSVGQAGKLPDFQRRLAELSGCRIELVDLPQARSLNDFYNGGIDLFWGLQSVERDRYGTFVGDGPAGQWVLITLPSAKPGPIQLRDFLGHPELRIGVTRGQAIPTDMNSDIQALRRAGQWDESVDDEMALNKLVHQRDAALLMVSIVADLITAQHKELPLRAIEQHGYAPPMGGAYVSRISLTPADQQTLINAVESLTHAAGEADRKP